MARAPKPAPTPAAPAEPARGPAITDKRTYMREYMRTYRGRPRTRLELTAEGSANLAILRKASTDRSNNALVERLVAKEIAALQAEEAQQASAGTGRKRGRAQAKATPVA